MKKSKIISFMLLACLVVLPISSFALPVAGQGSYGSFSGEINYSAVNENEAYIKIFLNNTSPEAKYVYLAGLTFGNPLIEAWSAGTAGTAGTASTDSLVQDGSSGGNIEIYFDPEKQVGLYFYLKGEKLNTINAESLLSNFIVFFSDGKGQIVDKASVSLSEPLTVILLGFGLVVLGIAARRRF
jgi:hypothetical protein